MKQSRLIAVALAIAVVTLGGWYLYDSGQITSSLDASVEAPSKPIVRPVTDVSRSHSGQGLLNSSTGMQLVVAIGKSAKSQGEEAYIALQLAQLCAEPHIVGTGQVASGSARALASFRATYCKGYTTSPEEAQQRILELPSDDPYLLAYGLSAELFDAAARNGKDFNIIAQELDSMVRSENSGLEALLAAEALYQVDILSPLTVDFARVSGWAMSRADLSEAQLLSVQMRMCARYGGCGPNQVLTMQLCAEKSACSLGGSAETMWRNSYSPAVYEAARKLATVDS